MSRKLCSQLKAKDSTSRQRYYISWSSMSRKFRSQLKAKDTTSLLNENTNTEGEKQWGHLWFPACSQYLIDRRLRVASTPNQTWRDNCLEPWQHAVKADDWVELFPRPGVYLFGSGTLPRRCLSNDPPWTATGLQSLAEAFVQCRRFEMQDALRLPKAAPVKLPDVVREPQLLYLTAVYRKSAAGSSCVYVSVCVCVNTALKGLVRASPSPWTSWVSPVGLAASSAGWRSVFLHNSATAALSPDTHIHRVHRYTQSRVNINFHKTALFFSCELLLLIIIIITVFQAQVINFAQIVKKYHKITDKFKDWR